MPIRVDPDAQRVRVAQSEIATEILRLAEKHGLTRIELLQALNEAEGSILKYALRAERHPDDPDRPADEA